MRFPAKSEVLPQDCARTGYLCVRVSYTVPEQAECTWLLAARSTRLAWPEVVTADNSEGRTPPPQPASVFVFHLLEMNDAAATDTAMKSIEDTWGLLPASTLSDRPNVHYPPMARAARAEGTVTLRLLVGPGGNVLAVTNVKGPAMLQQEASDALLHAAFQPMKIGGRAITFYAMFSVNFNLGSTQGVVTRSPGMYE
jgi:TonB family protein